MMKIKNASDLKSAIIILENRNQDQKQILIDQFDKTCESLRPRNLLRTAVSNIITSPALKNILLPVATSFLGKWSIPLFFKKKLVNSSPGFLKKVAGIIYNVGVKKMAAQYSNEIKSEGTTLFKRLINKFVENKRYDL